MPATQNGPVTSHPGGGRGTEVSSNRSLRAALGVGGVVGVWGMVPADIPGADPPSLAPVGVPVRPVGTGLASGLPAPDELLTERHRLCRKPRPGTWVVVDEQPPDEDLQAPEVVLVECPDLADQPPVDRHRLPLPADTVDVLG